MNSIQPKSPEECPNVEGFLSKTSSLESRGGGWRCVWGGGGVGEGMAGDKYIEIVLTAFIL